MILILGGTHEGKCISEALKARGLRHQLSVATALGLKTYSDPTTACFMARFTEETLYAYLEQWAVQLVIDATHPHALEIKRVAKAACTRSGIPYLRYARPQVTKAIDAGTQIEVFEEMSELIATLKRFAKSSDRFLITGVKHIGEFYAAFPKTQCYFRTMPSTYSMAQCELHQVPLDRIIAIKAPCPSEVNLALIKAYGITHFVFKDSGAGSAYLSNLEAVEKSGIVGMVLSSGESIAREGHFYLRTCPFP